MNLTSNPQVKAELDNLQIQFGNKAYLTLDDYADLSGIDRRYASRYVRRRNIPVSKEGRKLYISMLDLAIYKVKCKTGVPAQTVATRSNADEMKSRRGFSKAAERKAMGI